jgi:hypothetical protein
MAGLFTVFNCAIDATTGVMSGTSYAAGAKCAIQVAPATGNYVRVVEWGVSFSGSAAGTPAFCTLAQAATASTMTNAHSTSSILPVGDLAKTSTLQMGTSLTGYGNGAITSTTTERQFAGAQIGPMTQYEKQFPLGRDFLVLSGKFLQLRINTAATLTALAYVVIEEN